LVYNISKEGFLIPGKPTDYTIVDRSTMEQPIFFADQSDVEIIPISAMIKVRLSASSNLAEVSVCQDIKLEQLQKLCAKYLKENIEICLCSKITKCVISLEEFDKLITRRKTEKMAIPNLVVVPNDSIFTAHVITENFKTSLGILNTATLGVLLNGFKKKRTCRRNIFVESGWEKTISRLFHCVV